MNYAKRFSQRLIKELQATNSTKARKFLLSKGYILSSFRLPEYYAPSGLDKIALPPVDWTRRNALKITKTLDVLTPKSFLSWRSFNFLNPYIYIHTVNEMTTPSNWKRIKELLSCESLVYSYSVPKFSVPFRSNSNKEAILTWLQMAEKDLIKDCVNYHFLTTTDIKDFYPTIYTHSISWAIHQKVTAKARRNDYSLLGNKLDKLFQNARDGQTNGISVGSMVSDIVAEIILKDVDCKLSERIKGEKLEKKVLIARYRDDYRILSETEDQGKRVLRHLNRILSEEYDLYLNSDKTNSYSDVLQGAFRPWMLELKQSSLLRKIYSGDLSGCDSTTQLKDALLETYFLQKKHSSQRVCVSILARLTEAIEKDPGKIKIYTDDVMVIIAILRKMTLIREEVTPYVFSLFEILTKSLKTKAERAYLLKAIKNVISGKKDFIYQLIWFYRLCLSVEPKMCPDLLNENDMPLLRILERSFYKFDYKIFPAVTFDASESKELKKFKLIDRTKLKSSSGKSIPSRSLNPFNNFY